tara:strand:+ start:513 stop:947 length:435 start_codon:yes stop_codon:yes gene_type:complete
MLGSRKNTLEHLKAVYSLKNKHEKLKNIFVNASGEQSFQQCLNYHDELIQKFKEKLTIMPIGFRYTGTFYIKKSYSLELEFVKYDGTLYMREDLVSWEIESGRNGNEPFLNRFVYREPFLNSPLIKKEDADILPVFEKQVEIIA